MHKINFQLITKAAGVSKGLVSRALNDKANVSEKTRDKIIRVANSLGYDFNHLRSKKKKKFCLLVLTENMMKHIDFWDPIIRKITTTLGEHRIRLEYFIIDESISIQKTKERLQSIQTAGYVFIHYNPSELLEVANENNLPVVVIDPKYNHADKHWNVQFDNVATTLELTNLLAANGHNHILFYGPKNDSLSFDDRNWGFELGLKQSRNLKGYNLLFNNKSGNYEDKEKLIKVLNKNPQITAIICANDMIALNCERTIRELGKRVPDDYSLVGFDNIEESKSISLTTVNIPREELGIEAAKYLWKRLNDQQLKYSRLTIYCELLIRNSIRNINEGDH